MLFKNKAQIIRHNYTIVELLAVLVVVGILTGMTVSGIKGAIARQGAAGAVRTLGSKISLTRSFAVSRNRYVALLLPDSISVNSTLDRSTPSNDPIKTDNTSGFTDPDEQKYLFTQTRMCYVNKTYNSTTNSTTYTFDRWVEGYEWQKLPSKTVAFIVSESNGNSSDGSEKSNSASVENIEIDGDTNHSSSAIIFKPSGAPINARNVIIRVYRAAFLPEATTSNFIWQGQGQVGETPSKGWKIGINGFTGRTSFCEGRANIEND